MAESPQSPLISEIQSLAEVPGLEALGRVSEQFDVNITAFGSLVRRIAIASRRDNARIHQLDLFRLVPFLSDIDLYHDGTEEQAPAIRAAIEEQVPFSEYFRWQIYAAAELAEFRDDEACLPVIPANKLRLSTRGRGFEDSFGGLDDIRSRKYRFIASPYYFKSKLRSEYRDSPLIQALIYLHVLCEDKGAPDENELARCRLYLESLDVTRERIAFQESTYLRARLAYRYMALLATCRSEKDLRAAVVDSGFADAYWRAGPLLNQSALDMLDDDEEREEAFKKAPTFASSCRLGGDTYRTDAELPEDETKSADELWYFLVKSCRPLRELFATALPNLAAGQKVVGVSPRIRILPGIAYCAQGNEQLHIQFALPEPASPIAKRHELGDVGALLMLQASEFDSAAEDSSAACVLNVPVALSFLPYVANDRTTVLCQARVSVGQVFGIFHRLLKEARLSHLTSCFIRVFLIADET